jgi:FkbM family methyltransferase
MKLTKEGIAIIEGDTHIGVWVEQTGRLDHDQNTLPVILPYIKEGMVVVDAGANIGDHTIAYLDAVGASGRVIAFECYPPAIECLKYNCPKAEIHDCALSDHFDTIGLMPMLNAGATCVYYGNEQHQPDDLIECVPLDSLNLTRLDFLKMDIEGYEVFALRGARDTISLCRPIMVIEVNQFALENHGCKLQDLLDVLTEFKYEFKPLQEGLKVTDPQLDIICCPL